MQNVKDWWRSVSNSKYFPFVIFVLVVGAYIVGSTPRHTLRESPEYFACTKQAQEQYKLFWRQHPNPSVEEIQQADESYDTERGRCVEEYSIGWRNLKTIQE